MLTPTRRVFAVRRRRGLGQDSTDGTLIDATTGLPYLSSPSWDTSSLPTGTYGTNVLGLPSTPVSLPSTGTPTASSGGAIPAWEANLITGGVTTAEKIALMNLNPLMQKGTYYQTPQGAIYASSTPSSVLNVPGLTAAGSSMLPILLIGGAVVLFMMGRR